MKNVLLAAMLCLTFATTNAQYNYEEPRIVGTFGMQGGISQNFFIKQGYVGASFNTFSSPMLKVGLTNHVIDSSSLVVGYSAFVEGAYKKNLPNLLDGNFNLEASAGWNYTGWYVGGAVSYQVFEKMAVSVQYRQKLIMVGFHVNLIRR